MSLINFVPTTSPFVALTFDDGPHEIQTEKLIKLFAAEGARATFFEVGKKVRERPDLEKMLKAAGHEVGNHSMTHPHLPKLDVSEIRAQLQQTQEAVLQHLGEAPKVFRAPYLDLDERVESVVAELGLASIGGNRGCKDWEEKITVDEIIEGCTKEAAAGDIMILHTWQTKSFEAMPEILRRLKAKGLCSVTVSELLASAV